ncbi:hypothetical protein THAR02_03204 [Trichoderma harzianum]|uniref:Uncharacterized protein n=1 Tax=Trichoderma harzianum TaxID=5544 RepID=A0A0G0AIG3_TRIHA|nr:hypothetical protein THAR02_03204 [Trichoderma harzianum]
MHAFSKQYNRVITLGRCSMVSMFGFYLGGGHSPFGPSMGLGVDNVLEIEGGEKELNYRLFRDRLKSVLEVTAVEERNFKSAFDYVLSMPADKFLLAVGNPLPAPHPPSDNATGSQNSGFVSRQAMETKFAPTIMEIQRVIVVAFTTSTLS